jgi:hypothetical protein
MDNVPVHGNHGAPATHRSAEPAATAKRKSVKPSPRQMGITALVVALAAILLFAGWFFYRSSTGANIDGNKFQAVFFTNGQVYFGKLQTLNGGYMKLTDVFYLQAKSTTTTDDVKNPQATSTQETPDVQLIKLGSEIHGPDDEMIISRDQILFFENLKKDGKVAQSIAGYQSQK